MRRLLVSVVTQTSNFSLQPFDLFTKRANDALEFLVLRIAVHHCPTFAHGVSNPAPRLKASPPKDKMNQTLRDKLAVTIMLCAKRMFS